MSILDSLIQTGASIPSASDNIGEGAATPYYPLGIPESECHWDWERQYNAARQNQVFMNSNVGGFISPYEGHWNSSSMFMQNVEELTAFQPVNKVDPNKIYNSDIQALRALQQDQLKIVKLFETRLKESLNERGKMGLTEDDINAMQAVTAARTAIANIQKEQINIKKNISDTKIKQYQLEQADTKLMNAKTGGVNPDGTPQIGSAYDMGKSIIDSIFESATLAPAAIQPAYSSPTEAAVADADQAANFLDSIINNDADNNVNTAVKYEKMNPTTYVKIGSHDSDVSYETYAADGTYLPDYPNPTAKITNIDREAGIATNELMMTFQLKTEDSYDQISENESSESGFGAGSDAASFDADQIIDL